MHAQAGVAQTFHVPRLQVPPERFLQRNQLVLPPEELPALLQLPCQVDCGVTAPAGHPEDQEARPM